ncbi:MAG: hypothetical protein ABI222_03005 [Opitutaceae bacterium]
MNWNNLESTWKSQKAAAIPAANLASLLSTFESKSRAEACRFLWRDLREGIVGIFLSGYFAYKTWKAGPAYWPIGVAVAILAGIAVFFLIDRLRARGLRLSPDAALLAKVDADLAELRHQRRLYDTVTAWGLAPLALAMVIIVATAYYNKPEMLQSARHIRYAAGYFVAVVALFWYIRTLNQRILHRQIEPRISELERLRDNLTSPP